MQSERPGGIGCCLRPLTHCANHLLLLVRTQFRQPSLPPSHHSPVRLPTPLESVHRTIDRSKLELSEAPEHLHHHSACCIHGLHEASEAGASFTHSSHEFAA